MYKKVLVLTLAVMLSPAVLGNIIVDDDFDNGAIGTNTTGIGTGFNSYTATGGAVTETNSRANLNDTGNGAARAVITSKDAAAIGSGITRFEFKGLTFALSVAGTGTGPSRTVVGVKHDDQANDPDAGTDAGFYVQFESDSFSNTAHDGAWNGISALIYVAENSTPTVLARWSFNTLNWDSGTQNFTPVLDVTLDLNPTGYSLTIEGDTITLLSGALSNSYAAAGITNELTTGYAYVFNQTEFPLINLSVDRIIVTEGATPIGLNPYATAIYPANGQLEVPINATLSWKAGAYAATHNVYFSTSFDDVNTAKASAWVSHYQSGTTYNPGILPYGTTYYWRIDEVNSPGTAGSHTYNGSVWKFTTDLTGFPIGYLDSPIRRITPTASSRLDATQDPNKTIGRNTTGLKQGSGPYKTYYIDANLITVGPGNMWLTNSTDTNRWIKYIFDKEYKVRDMLVWNYNETTPLAICGIYYSKFGIKDVNITTTTDFGTNWSASVQTQLKKATELPTYQAIDPINGNNIEVGSTITGVTLQAINNWSGGLYSGYGLGEVMFLVAPTYANNYTVTTGNNNTVVNTSTATVDPNTPNSRLNWKIGRDSGVFASSHKVYIKDVDNDALNNSTPADPNSARNAVRDNTIAALTTTDPNYLLNSLPNTPATGLNMQSTYYWRVDEVIGAKTWMNNSVRNNYLDIQSFKTVGSRLVTNFEAQSSLIGGGIFVSSPVHGGSVAFRIPIDKTSGNIELGPVNPFYYNINSNNWQPGNPTMLVVYFYGDPNNTGVSMYLKIKDATKETKIVYGANPAQEDISLLKRAAWSRWNVPLTGVTLSNVMEISYGVDISGGTGLGQILFDDLTLYRLYPPPPTPTQPSDVNLMVYYNFNNNVTDQSSHGYNATMYNSAPIYSTSISTAYGQAMDCNGPGATSGDYATMPIGSLVNTLRSTTIALWLNFRNTNDWNRAFDIGTSTTNYMFLTPRTGTNSRFAIRTTAIGEQIVNGPRLAIGWHHVAVVIDSTTMRLKLFIDGAEVGNAATVLLPKDLGVTTNNWLCRSQYTADTYYNGLIDEFRIYNKALTDGEILYLANPSLATVTK